MGRFKPGQKVVCIKRGEWIESDEKKPSSHYGLSVPAFNEIVTIDKYKDDTKVWLIGYIPSFNESRFEPLVSDAVLEKELESVPKPFTV